MLRKSLIALAATAALGIAMAGTAEAKHHHHNHGNINIDLGFGGFGGYGYGYGSPYYAGYDDDCGWQIIKVKKWNKWHTAYIVKHKIDWSCY